MTGIVTVFLAAFVAFQAGPLEPQDVLEPLAPEHAQRNPWAPREPQAPAAPPALEPIRGVDIEMEEPGELFQIDPEMLEGGPKYEPGTELYVTASSLAFRKGPRRDAMLIRYLPRDTKLVTLFDVLDPVPFSADGLDGHWIYVEFGNYKGYVFDGYLAQTPPSLEKMLDWMCVPGVRVGPITHETTYDLLGAIFGKENVTDAQFPLGEGEFEPGTAVFPDDPEKEVVIQWEVYHEVPQAVLILGHKWKTPRGIALGTRLSSLVAMNGGPLTFAGFAWDYAGFVTSWRGGALEEDHPLRTGMALHLAPKKPYLPTDYEQLTGDSEFSSDQPAAGKLNIEVGRITVMINRPED